VKFRKAVHLLMGIQREQRMSKDMVVKAKAALFKSIPNRSEEDYMWIERFMMRLEFIHHLREEHGLPLVREFCRNLYYQRFNEGDEVIHVNREGRTFYVILSGSVAVYVYRPKNETVNSRMKVNMCCTLQKLIKNHEEECIDYDDSIQFERAEVKVLVQGESFGELSLLDFRNRTTATIVAKQVCEFSCLDRKQYWEILGRIKRVWVLF
jgi:CRP-like cAMP-binding protein